MTKLEGIFAATISVLNKDLSLDISATIEHALYVDRQGSGLVFLGSTSQSQLLSIQEKKDLIKEISKHKFQNQVIIGTGCNSLKDTINLMRHSIEFGHKNFLIGISDHTKDINSSLAAVSLGASIIEKHFNRGPLKIPYSFPTKPQMNLKMHHTLFPGAPSYM